MSDRCHEHKSDLAVCPIDCVLAAIYGRECFVWLPVLIHGRGGHYVEGVRWLTTVIKRRRIGHPSYFYTLKDKP